MSTTSPAAIDSTHYWAFTTRSSANNGGTATYTFPNVYNLVLHTFHFQHQYTFSGTLQVFINNVWLYSLTQTGPSNCYYYPCNPASTASTRAADLSSHGITTSSVTVSSTRTAARLVLTIQLNAHGYIMVRDVHVKYANRPPSPPPPPPPPPPPLLPLLLPVAAAAPAAAATLAATATVAATVAATLAATSVAATVATSSVAAAVAAAFPKHLEYNAG